MEINPITAHLVQLISDNTEKSGQQLLEQIAEEIPQMDSTVIISGGMETLKELRNKNIIPGTKYQ